MIEPDGAAGPRRAVFAALLLLSGACGGETQGGSRPSAPAEERLIIATDSGRVELRVDVADEPAERQQGLMGVQKLEQDRGMVFLPDEAPSRQRFWMKNTLIPLSIAWWDDQGQIVAIQDMEPCEAEPCEIYDPGVDSVGAVEVNQGFFDERGVEVGDTVELIAGTAAR